MYSEKTKKELIDLLRKEKEENQKLLKKVESFENREKNIVPKEMHDALKNNYNTLVQAYQNCVKDFNEYAETLESTVKSIQGLEGLISLNYTKLKSINPYIQYGNILKVKE